MKRRIAINVLGDAVEILAQLEGEYAVAAARHGMVINGSMGYAVFRRVPEQAWQPIVSGLDRDVAVAVAMDMNKVQQREPEGARLADLQAVLRRYLGSFAL